MASMLQQQFLHSIFDNTFQIHENLYMNVHLSFSEKSEKSYKEEK